LEDGKERSFPLIQSKMKKLKEFTVVLVTVLSVFIFTSCGMLTYYGIPGGQVTYQNPGWAPPYYNGARYYYIPDIESYYDLSSGEFAVLNDGQWRFTSNISLIYPEFDLNNCFAVVLNVDVYQPWSHHQYYVSHYPRYYYRDYYDHSNIPYVRGFNENSASAIYYRENERSRARSWDNRNLNENRQFQYTRSDRQEQKTRNNQSFRIGSSNSNNTTQGGTPDNSRNNTNTNRGTENNNVRNTNQNTIPTVTRNPGDNAVNSQPQRNSNSNTTPVNVTRQQTDKPASVERTSNTTPVNVTRQQTDKPASVERTSNTNYYGKAIGNPVKVTKQMRNVPKSKGQR